MIRMSLLAAAALAGAACVEPAPELGSFELASLVSDHETSTCSTAVVIELSRQIAAEVDCMAPGQLVPFAEGGDVVFAGAAVLPYVSEQARADLLAAVAAGGGVELQITSAYRTVVQQYLLYRWFELGRCGITAAAVPGNSNHESGRAIDVSNYDAWLTRLGEHDWDQTVPGDPVHFDHAMSPDLRGTDVLAFQRLWTRNNPGDLLDEDGAWGPQTEARVAAATAEGFALGAMCVTGGYDVALEAVDAPRVLAPGEPAVVTLTLRNSGTVAWPAGTALVTAEPAGRASDFADASWAAADRPAVIDGEVAPGASVEVGFAIVAPGGGGERTESFALAAGDSRFGMIGLVIQIDPEGGTASGGCDSGGGRGGGGGVMLLIGLAALIRRRVKP